MAEMYTNTSEEVEGRRVITATPFDDRLYFETIAALRTIDTDVPDFPYRSFEGMVVYTIDTGQSFMWKESGVGELTSGGFTYPSSYMAGSINYSSRTFNFVEVNSNNFSISANDDTYGLTNIVLGGQTFVLNGGDGINTDTDALRQVTFHLDVNGLTARTIDPASDYIVFWDASEGVHSKELAGSALASIYKGDGSLTSTRTLTGNTYNLNYIFSTGRFDVTATSVPDVGELLVDKDFISLRASDSTDTAQLLLNKDGSVSLQSTGLSLIGSTSIDDGAIKIYERTANGSNFGTLKAPSTGFSADWTWELPVAHRPYDIITVPVLPLDTTLNTAGTGVIFTWVMPVDYEIVDVIVGVTTAPTGTVPSFDITEKGGASIFSVNPTIDASEFSSETATTALALSTTTINAGTVFDFEIDAVDGGTTAAGLYITFVGYQI